MEDFYIGGASVKLFLPIFKMNFPEIVDLALPAEGVFHNLVFVSIRKTYPMQAYKIMHGLWGMGQMMLTKYIVVVDDDMMFTIQVKCCFACVRTQTPNAIQFSQKGQPMFWTMQRLKSRWEQSWESMLRASSPAKASKGRGRR
jgi:UbiD family decarboxylase